MSVPDTATWITDIDWSKDGVVKFNIAANYAYSQRYTVMTISYSMMALSFSVVQEAYEMSSFRYTVYNQCQGCDCIDSKGGDRPAG